jgi:hypothetical protein
MNARTIDFPANPSIDDTHKGWIWDGEKWVSTAVDGGAGAGMVISETEPTDKVEGMQWLNPTTGLVLFWDDEKWLQMPGGADGADGKDAVWSEDANGASYTGTVTVTGDLLAAKSDAGDNAVAVGASAGANAQGANSVAVGYLAGKTNQGANSVAVGLDAGQTNQAPNAVSVGRLSGQTTQGENAVAIGYVAGQDNQGQDSIAIGNRAGQTNQAANGIIINSSGGASNSDKPHHISIASGFGKYLDYNGADTWTFAGGDVTGGGLRFKKIVQDGSPVIDAKGLISTLSTLRNATKDETTLEGMRDALADAIGGLIENLEHEIATMPVPEPEASTQEIAE